MPDGAASGFWSYAHDDNKLDNGAILELARLLKDQYNLLSGEPLNLFIDRDSIAWGQEWLERIDSFLAQTTFFIPIITPRYFARPECRRELLEFAGKSKSLGVEELLLPIIYVETDGLSPESSDEAVAIVARTHQVDWIANRLLDTRSREYKAEVNVLARRLLEIARNVADAQLNNELNAGIEESGDEGLTDIVERIMALLPDWLDAVMGEKTNNAQLVATYNQYIKQVKKLRSRRVQSSAILGTQMRMCKEILPLAERAQKESRIYLARSVELDPLISSLIRLVADHPDSIPLITAIEDAIHEAMIEVRTEDDRLRSHKQTIGDALRELKHLGRIFQKCIAMLDDNVRSAHGGNNIVRRWDAELNNAISLASEASVQSSEDDSRLQLEYDEDSPPDSFAGGDLIIPTTDRGSGES